MPIPSVYTQHCKTKGKKPNLLVDGLYKEVVTGAAIAGYVPGVVPSIPEIRVVKATDAVRVYFAVDGAWKYATLT